MEVLAGPADDHGTRCGIRLDLADCRGKCVAHLRAHGVRMFWIIQRDDGDGLLVEVFEMQS